MGIFDDAKKNLEKRRKLEHRIAELEQQLAQKNTEPESVKRENRALAARAEA